ncbi:MAG TPA: amino acid adenylation domain-containing protein [Noviherbaspirillum sp.]|nr:amino acid adenylation domain-containing protein [Noviherbaspirillum sp.]
MTEKIALVFSGIGTQWIGMAESLLADDPVFRDAVSEIDALFLPLRRWSVLALLSGRDAGVSLDQPEIAHPAIFSVQYGLSRCLAQRGLQPAAVIGHSAGEVAAAVCAGALSLPDAVRVVAAHSELISQVQPGAMLHVPLDPQTVSARIAAARSGLELAVINSDQAAVVAGTPEAIAALDAELQAEGIDTRLLRIRVPFHTRAVEPHLDHFRACIADIQPQQPALAFYSSLRGGLSQGGDFSADYWVRHIRETVQFPAAARALLDQGVDRFIEVSPHPALLQHLAVIAGDRGATMAFDAILQRGMPQPTWPQRQEHAPASALDAATVSQALQESATEVLGAAFSLPAAQQLKWTELGCTSLQITQVMAKLSARLGKPLSVTLPYRHPTPAALIAALAGDKTNDAPRAATAFRDAPVAIVGMACRFPGGADSPDALWELLTNGVDPITEIPPDRWPADAFYDADRNAKGRSVSRWGGFIQGQDLREFDARHFRMTPREASALDPQQRLLLEVTWEAIENAGLSVAELKGKQVGVYVAISTDDYKNSMLYHDIEALDPYAGAGAMNCTAAGRLSYFFGWEGPNFALDTACSGSLVALHLACQALQSGECDFAVVGGVNALLTPHLYVYFSKTGIMSPTGRCHVFDDDADGYVRAEGCGMLVLQREPDAQRDGRRLRARVLGSAVNQDGASSGFSAPNGAAQQKVLRQAWRQADVTAADIGYLEAHGTGTPIGDPIELEAMAEAIAPQRTPHDPMPVGSLKSNLGHLEAAAGVGAVIKTVLALEHGELPANLHFHKPNSHIDWAQLPLRVVDRRQPFPQRGQRRIAGVSSFGFSGTNAHAVLEQATSPATAPVRPVQVLTLGAHDQAGLRQLARDYVQRIAKLDEHGFADLACATHLARQNFSSRVAAAGTPHEIGALLTRWADQPAEGEQIFAAESGSDPLVFAFTGQGCQYPGMAQALYASEPVFRAVLDRCENALVALRGSGMLHLMLDPEADPAQFESTDLAQPAIFAVQCGIVALLGAWGIKPQRVVGHSVGEFAAAVTAGVLELEDALALVAQRGSLMAGMPAGGAMAAVQVDEQTALGTLHALDMTARGKVALAAVNGARSVVLSGEAEALDAVLAQLGAPGARAKRLVVSHAYHSPLMAPAAEAFARAPAPVFRTATLPWISTVDGSDLSATGVNMAYWSRQILSPVRFHDALTVLEAQGCRHFIEIGPAAVLTQMGRARDGGNQRFWISTQQRQRDGNLTIASALAFLAAHGQAIDWARYDDPAGRRRADLPPYPFQRRRHWREPVLPQGATTLKPDGAPYPWLNRYAGLRLLEVLQTAGWLEPGTPPALPAWQRHYASCLSLLATAGLVSTDKGTVILTPLGHRADSAGLVQERTRFLSAHPSLSGCLGLLDDCISRYPDILSGRLDPLTVLFPGGSMERVASVYANNEVQDQFNRHVGDTVAQWCRARLAAAPARRLRIVEIGAGTGSTTAAVLAALPAGAPVDYCFTDVSPAFLTRAKQRFGHLRFALLNIERSPAAQGFSESEADLVIANNVLHATADIAVTLAHVRWLSAPGSALVLNEQTELQAFIHLIFGLTEGWWRFTDALRQDAQSPILSRQDWTAALNQTGFDVQPQVFSTDAGQTVFVANAIKKDVEMARNLHAPVGDHAASLLAADSALNTIRDMVAELTGMVGDEIDADTALIDLGLDSLMLVQMKTLLENRLGLEVDMADFYGDLDTVARLANVAPAMASTAASPTMSVAGGQGERPAFEQAASMVQTHYPHPNPPPAWGRESVGGLVTSPAGGAMPQGDLARLMALQLESMSRMISEQNALLANAPAALPATSQTVALPAPSASVAPLAATSATKDPAPVKSSTPNFRSLKLDSDKLTAEQKTFVEDLARRYAARTPSSKALADRTRHTLADWKNTLSFRYSLKEMMYPLVAATSHGSHFTDLDGNDFLDMTMGCGIALLGHSPECVTKAVHAQVDASFAIGPQTPLAAEVAERFARITGLERVTFCNTGAEAVMMAVRIARAVTGRSKIAIFSGAYHGTWDGVLGVEHEGHVHPIAAGIPQGMVDDLIILNYGTDEALAALRAQAGELAAVLVEPVQSRRPGFHPAEFLKQLRTITHESGSALIFDEMITGFRIHPGGGQAHFGVKADLATYGKIVGGGLPLSVVAGSARFMDVVDGGDWQYGDASKPESDVIYFGGTYVKHPLALAAAKASLDHIERVGEAGYTELNRRSKRMADTLNDWFASEAVPLTVTHFGSLFRIDGTGRYSSIMQPVELDLFFLLLNLRSIYVWERRICFLSFAHTDAEVDHLIECAKDAVRELRAAGFEFRSGGSGGKPPSPGGGQPAGGAGNTLHQDAGPAASAQRRMFALAEIEGPSVVYNVPLAIHLHGPLDLPRLEQTLAALVERHPALRTRFAVEDDALLQKIDPAMPFSLERIDAGEAQLTERLNAFVQPFDLKTGPLFRAGLIHVAADRHVLIMDAHHIVVDGLSLNILAQELMAGYNDQPLPERGASMIDYAGAEAAYLSSDVCRRDAEYWQAQFRSVPEPLQLPLDHPRPLRRRHQGADLLGKLDSVATARLKAAARAHKMPVFPLLLTLYATLLHRISAQDDIVIGLPVGGRTDPRFRSTVGMLAATLPLRMRAAPQEPLAACARACHKSFLNALSHQAYPLETLIASLDLPRDTSRNPLFDTMFIYEDGNDRVYRMSGLDCAPAEVSRNAAMFDLAMEVVEAEGELTLRCEYDVDLFSAATAQSVLDIYLRLLHLAPDMLDLPVGDLNLVDAHQRATLLSWGDGGPAALHGTVLQAFDAQLTAAPDATALVCNGVSLSYRELDQRANRLAHTLLADGPLPKDTPVALVSQRDAGLLVGMLAILRAGAAYVPVDPDFPLERVRLMLEASGCRHVLASPALAGELPLPAGTRILRLDAVADDAPSTAPHCAITPDRLAYIIFTSGSTGTPKGTMLSHRNAAAFFAGMPHAFGFNAGDRILGVTTVSFDIAGLELLGALSCGMTVVLASAEQTREPVLLLDLIEREKVNVLQMTPTRLRLLLDVAPTLPGLRTLLVGGEALPQTLADKLLALDHLRVFNVYGPTETTIWSACWPLAQGPVSLGRALPGERLLVLSAQHRLQPPAAIGEIAIAGVGVARGYLNDPARTADSFITLPGIDGPVYLTGDLGRWRPDGSLEYLGRRDDQVKVRGMRIEIGDIEHHLRQLPEVTDAVAAIRKNALGEADIVAYLVGPQPDIDVAVLRTALAASLPAAMIPARFMVLPALPQTPNGKTDRRALPNPEPQANTRTARVPNGPVEEALTGIFCEVLGASVGPDDDFFLAGGESIRALRLASRIRAIGLAFELPDLFRWPTPAALAAQLKPLAPPQAPETETGIGTLSGLSDAELTDLFA